MSRYLERSALDDLIAALQRRGFRTVGPVVRDGAIVYDELESARDLPIGWTDRQEAGTYRLERRNDDDCFGYVVGPHSWKKFLFPPTLRLWSARREPEGQAWTVASGPEPAPRYAFIGVRSCELSAIAIQDRVFLEDSFVDPRYRDAREGQFTVAVNCGQAGGTCFCASMGTGPRCRSGFDLVLTEIRVDGRHGFLVESGTEAGDELLGDLPHREPDARELEASRQATERAEAQMGRRLQTEGVKELLYANQENARWDEVAERCLSCANCTMVCPTCFCSDVEDVTDLAGDRAERVRTWDSCFNVGFSYIHGGSVRTTTRARYRQWLTHKLASWIDQFGTSGCVGCGRCITWCPVGIDITEEVRAIREGDSRESSPAAAETTGESK